MTFARDLLLRASLLLLGVVVAGCGSEEMPPAGPPAGSAQQQGAVVVTITPKEASVGANRTVGFSATVTVTTDTSIDWSVSAGTGTISNEGVFTAGDMPGVSEVTASSKAEPGSKATAKVTIYGIDPCPTIAEGWQDVTPGGVDLSGFG